ncbi:MAG TPA: ATP-binding protein [Nocardioidaceae bacterium]|nr:ATP-binding protein [Nocardioidaceae bacterium]
MSLMVRLARAWWWTIATTGAAMYVAALPSAFREIRAGERAQFVDATEFRSALESSGWDPSVAASVVLALLLAYTVAAGVASAVVYKTCSDVPAALLVSSVLLAHGLTWPMVSDALSGRLLLFDVMGTVLAVYGLVGLLCLGFVFPDGRFVPAWTRWVVAAVALDVGLGSSGVPLPPVIDLAVGGSAAIALMYSIAYRYRRVSSAVERRQSRAVGLVLVLVVTSFVLIGSADGLIRDSPEGIILAEYGALTVYTLGFAALPLAIGAATLRQGLWGARRVLRRALAITAVTSVLALVYLGVVVASAAVAGDVVGPVGTTLGAVAVALALDPVRRRLSSWAKQLTLGDREDAGAAVVRLAQRLDEAHTPEESLRAVLSAVRDAVRAPGASVTDGSITACDGAAPREADWHRPLVHHGETIGVLRVARRPGPDDFDEIDRRLLAELTRPVSVAVNGLLHQSAATRMARDLQASRERLIVAREEERRRLRRDLHDRLGPILAGQVLRLETAAELVRRDPDEATALIRRGAEEAAESLAEVRRVVDGLRPAEIDDAGLDEALRRRAAQLGQNIVVREPPHPLPDLPAAVEVAAYHIASEAMTNAVRHANGATCWARLAVRDDTLVVVVEDDGPGLTAVEHPPARPGAGLSTMAERAAELGGSVRCATRLTGGTRVTAIIPLDAVTEVS